MKGGSHMNRIALSLSLGLSLWAVAACHHNDASSTAPDLTETQKLGNEPGARDESGDMISPDKMDEVNKDLDRKRETVSRCLAIAIDNKDLPKNSKGKMTLEIVIANGKAQSVKVIKETLESKALDDCVIGKVNEIEFPQLAKQYETSYTFTFEAI